MSEFDVVGEAGSGFGGEFTRFFSWPVLGVAVLMFCDELVLLDDPDANAGLALWLGFIGLHGVITTSEDVGCVRKLLCYLSGVASATLVFGVLKQLLG